MSIAGVNIDPRNPLGDPSAAKLTGFNYARFPYDVSIGTGSLDYEAAHAFYRPRLDALRAAGITPIVILTHRLWGEGRGFNWNMMTANDWNAYIGGLIDAIRRTVTRYTGRGHIYQIGNEHDQASEASIYMPPQFYGALFRLAYDAIKTIDSSARVIIGGLVSGPGKGIAYYNAASIAQHDGIGIHTYGAGAGGLYNQFGTIETQITEWRKLNRQLWITEFGVLDKPNEPAERVAAYAAAFMNACAGKAEAAIWYGWADGMHNGYGVESGGVIRKPLFEALTALPAIKKSPYKPGAYVLTIIAPTVDEIYLRRDDMTLIAALDTGDRVDVTHEDMAGKIIGGKYFDCIRVRANGQDGIIAYTTSYRLDAYTAPEPQPDDGAAFRAEMRELFESIAELARLGLARLDAYEAEAAKL